MKGLVCKFCGHISLSGKTDICPVCGQKLAFEQKEEAYKTPDTIVEKGESEKKHIPNITVINKCGLIPDTGCIDVHVKVGEIVHPMTPEHSIQSITFYLNNEYIGIAKLTSAINPAAVVHLKGGTKGKLQVIEHCNLHGSWINEVVIE
jgi:superoxide reductase